MDRICKNKNLDGKQPQIRQNNNLKAGKSYPQKFKITSNKKQTLVFIEKRRRRGIDTFKFSSTL